MKKTKLRKLFENEEIEHSVERSEFSFGFSELKNVEGQPQLVFETNKIDAEKKRKQLLVNFAKKAKEAEKNQIGDKEKYCTKFVYDGFDIEKVFGSKKDIINRIKKLRS